MVSVGTFQAGIASNVIPESAVMELSVRAMKPEIRDLLIKRILSSLTLPPKAMAPAA